MFLRQKIELMHGDAKSLCEGLPSDICDMVFTSPPYNMNLRVRNGKHCSRQIVKEISTKYKNFDDNIPMDEYHSFNVSIVQELLRLAPLVFYNIQFLTGNKSALFRLIGDLSNHLKEVIIWDKINAQPAIGEGVLNSQFEVILVFAREDAIMRQFKNANFERGTLSNLWSIKRGKKPHKSHGAVFPEELARKVITNFTWPGQRVLDPFMGTGTTGVVCAETRRGFLGIEIDKDYYDFAKQRIDQATC